MKNVVKKLLVIALMAVVTLTLSGVAISSAEVREKALNTAIEQAGVNAEEIFDVEVEIEKKNGVVIIEVEFQTEGKEYEYHINKATGEVISSTIKNDDYRPGSNSTAESGKDIITKVEALDIALADAGLKGTDVKDIEIDLDEDDSVLHYEVEFERKATSEKTEYEYDIDAYTGKILKKVVDNMPAAPSPTPEIPVAPTEAPTQNPTEAPTEKPAVPQLITRDEALQIALDDAGLKKSEIKKLEVDLDNDDGVLSYEIEFERKLDDDTSDYEYEYDIDAYTGEILKKEVDEIPTPEKPVVKPEAPQIITRDEALRIALKDAGLEKADIVELELELDDDDGVLSYEIEFDRITSTSKTEYEYDIDAYTGKILNREVDKENFAPVVTPNPPVVTPNPPAATPNPPAATPNPPAAPQLLTRDEALAIVLKDAGVNRADVIDLEVELDRDDGFTVYEVEFETYKNGAEIEYEYDIDAYTGEILKKEIDIDD